MIGVKAKSPRFAMRFQEELKKRDINPRQFSAQIDAAYDHVRKVYNGDVFPGPNMLKLICGALGFDYEQMNKLVKQDRAVASGWTEAATGISPEVNQLALLWPKLTQNDKDEILTLAQLKFERQQATGKAKKTG